MVRRIIRDEAFLSIPSEPAQQGDGQVGQDLQDTLCANADRCVGMAANMIGVRKKIIVVNPAGGPFSLLMFNPEILRKEGPYMTEESCLSLDGVRQTLRYEMIEVSFMNASWKPQRMAFTGFAAQIIQHEIDHLSGILI
ncbi:MAG: peptide deformylase [Clostridia bacterium]|nr:peptide deformylase [Clostridia bacterium]